MNISMKIEMELKEVPMFIKKRDDTDYPLIIQQVNEEEMLIRTRYSNLIKLNLKDNKIFDMYSGYSRGIRHETYQSINKFIVPQDTDLIFILITGSEYHSPSDEDDWEDYFWYLKILSLKDLSYVGTIEYDHNPYSRSKEEITTFSITEDLKLLAVARNNNNIDINSLYKREKRYDIKRIYSVNFGESIDYLDFHSQLPVAFAANNKNVWLWEVKSGNLLKDLTFEYIHSIMFGRKSNDLLIAYNNSSKAVQIFDIDKLEIKSEIALPKRFHLRKVALHPSGRYVAIDGDKRICLFDIQSKEEVGNIEIGEEISAISFDLKGDNIFVGTEEKSRLIIISIKP